MSLLAFCSAALTTDHLIVLQMVESGRRPDIQRTRWRMALAEVRAWGLVRADDRSLTPAGAKALADARRAR